MNRILGGYQTVNFGHVVLSDVKVTFAGLYEKFRVNLGKPMMLCNINIGGTEYQDCYCQPVLTDSGIEMTVGDYTLTVSSDSGVTVQSGIIGVEPPEIGDLEDVDITDPSDGDTLVYDSESEKWKNGKTGENEVPVLQQFTLYIPNNFTFPAVGASGTIPGTDCTKIQQVTDLLNTITPILQGEDPYKICDCLNVNFVASTSSTPSIDMGTIPIFAYRYTDTAVYIYCKGVAKCESTTEKFTANVTLGIRFDTTTKEFIGGNITVLRLT